MSDTLQCQKGTIKKIRALHGKFTAVVYRGKAYHGIPWSFATIYRTENRTIFRKPYHFSIYHFVP